MSPQPARAHAALSRLIGNTALLRLSHAGGRPAQRGGVLLSAGDPEANAAGLSQRLACGRVPPS